jgi:hypothetical protein
VPDALPVAGAVVLTTLLAVALAVRTGGHAVLAGGLALLLGAAAALSGVPQVEAAAAVTTAVLGAVLGVLATVPSPRLLGVARECGLAVLVGLTAAFGVRGYGAQLDVRRTGYLVLGLSVLGALAVAARLAVPRSGPARTGVLVLVGGLVVLAVVLAYGQALDRWGPPSLVDAARRGVDEVHDLAGAVPRPTVFLVGVPALAWGTWTRARRRQGWWGTAVGAVGLGTVTTMLVGRAAVPESLLATAYSLVVGLLLGVLAIRADRAVTAVRGRRARGIEQTASYRPEPARTRALL